MTVHVKLPDGGTDEYLRSGDAYVQHGDGTLDVVRTGSKGVGCTSIRPLGRFRL